MVTVEIQRWPGPAGTAAGRVVEVLGRLDDPGVDTEIVLRKHGIADEHAPDAVAQARGRDHAVERPPISPAAPTSAAGTIVTIDGEHARDFDDAISIERLPNGHYWLGVHIADVAHYVPEGSALDLDGFARGTSVYFPERAVHMFPSELATGVCSLNPHVDRLVQSCLMEVDGRGEVVRYELHDGVIHSRARMTYTAVNAIVTDRDPALRAEYAALVPAFERMRDAVRDPQRPAPPPRLDRLRPARGRGGGRRRRARSRRSSPSERNVAHRIIEEFMLLANETVAAHLEREDMPALYRVHETPDPQRVEEFEEFVSSLGLQPGGAARRGAPAALPAPGRAHPRHARRSGRSPS